MKQAANKLEAWTNKWFVAIRKEKYSTNLHLVVNKAGPIKLGDTTWKIRGRQHTLVSDLHKQTWRLHIQEAEAKVRWKLVILWKLATISWGASKQNSSMSTRERSGLILRMAQQLDLQQQRPTSNLWTRSKAKPSGSSLDACGPQLSKPWRKLQPFCPSSKGETKR